ncbi:HAD-IIB family hydrolase [Neobacillus terrae]|uniref:HAD-IIB family hydrolase n=1 Tax=Neobacillus terrae TaxID=3034837 RepID=UPI001407413F|nr:HAD family hydrolase [Neobacillus terrae]NHM31437.1 HAD family phosphatase [Neobacillus terrae]
MYKMVFLDIDGTILSPEGVLNPYLIDTVRDLMNADIKVGLATGRSLEGAKLYGDLLGCVTYVVYNGGLVIDGGQAIFENRIPSEIAHYACKTTEKLGGTYLHYLGSESYSNQPRLDTEYLLPFAAKTGIEDTNRDAHRLALFLEEKVRQLLMKELSDVSCYDEGDRLEVFHKGSKWTGIVPVIKKYGITPEEVITIGNSFNDLGMIENAGMGIAVGSAPDEVKSRAKLALAGTGEEEIVQVLRKLTIKACPR